MTIKEFSDQFDTLVNSFSRDIEFGKDNSDIAFTEYEKSLYLTRAQEQLVITLYNGKNTTGDSFESSEEVRRYLEPLVKQGTGTPKVSYNSQLNGNTIGIKLNSDVLFIVYEDVSLQLDKDCLPSTNIQVQPITHDEYHKVKNNPFRGPNNHRVLRLDINLGEDNNQYVELISKYPITLYNYRYIRKPRPIILESFDDNLSLGEGEHIAQTSELNTALHDRILDLAVRMALQAKGITINNNQQGAQ